MNATDKQIAFIVKLATERGFTTIPTEDLTKATASQMIEDLLAMPRVPAQKVAKAAEGVLEPGMYRKANGEMYRVYKARGGSHLLAKILISTDEAGGYSFEYAGAASRFVSPSERMTLEEAKAFGVETGTCCVCAAVLTDPTSVAAGIGPVCGGRV